MSTIFDQIVSGEMKSWTVWEDENYLAFLTPFANTPGHTVVIPKQNPGDYVFGVSSEVRTGLIDTAEKVAHMLEKAFNTTRVGMVFDGTGVAHLHAQLIPMHANMSTDKDEATAYRNDHHGLAEHISAQDGPKLDDAELDKIQAQIKAAA